MSDERVLTKEIAEQFLADEDSVDVSEFTAIEDEAAEVLGRHDGPLYLDGLTSLSETAAEKLSQHEGSVFLDSLERISEVSLKALSTHCGAVSLMGITELDCKQAEALATFEWGFRLGVTICELDESVQSILEHHPSGRFDNSSLQNWLHFYLAFDVNDAGTEWLGLQTVEELEKVAVASSRYIDGYDDTISTSVANVVHAIRNAGNQMIHEVRLYNGSDSEFIFVGPLEMVKRQINEHIRLMMNSGEEVLLTKDIAEQFLEDENSIDLYEFSSIDNRETAELLAQAGGLEFKFSSLHKETACGLSGHNDSLYFQNPGFPVTEDLAEELGKHTAHLALYFDCSDISAGSLQHLYDIEALELGSHDWEWILSEDQAVELSKHVGSLSLCGVQDISASVAKHLSSHNGELAIRPLDNLSVEAAEILSNAQCDLDIWVDDLPTESAEILKKHHSFS